MQWLLFVPQVPAKPDYLRVKLRRRLAKLGAIPVKAAVYALPHQGDCLEDLAWLRQDLRKDGGDAVICSASVIAGTSDDDLIESFSRERTALYAGIAEEAGAATKDDAPATLRKLRRRLNDVVEIDYFNADGRSAAEQAVRQLEARIQTGDSMRETASRPHHIEQGRTWVTRAGIKVDRMASAWLIRRFIDQHAKLRFVDPANYTHADGELRFDMFDGEYTHHGDHCTFETLVAHFTLHDRALRALAEIVHDIDVKDAKFERPETAGIAIFIEGFVAGTTDDGQRLERGRVLFDSLYDALSARA
ncbi:MAG: chromate resistance protein ChrB domain-containing protein [Gemmatimonadota bacterium]